MSLAEIPTAELKAELARRAAAEFDASLPKQLEVVDVMQIRASCRAYIRDVAEKKRNADDDDDDGGWEERDDALINNTLVAAYGPDIWKWISANT